jgi:transcription initiation factor TFIIIB Brf1 subunit/transcription initiation factor TFIIB
MAHARAAELVDEFLEQIEGWQSNQLQRRARGFAARGELHHPINRTPSTIAAGAIRVASLLVNEKLTQTEIADQVDVSRSSVGKAEHEIVDHEGLQRTDADDPNANQAWWRRTVRRLVRR